MPKGQDIKSMFFRFVDVPTPKYPAFGFSGKVSLALRRALLKRADDSF